VSLDIFWPFMGNNFSFWAVYSLEKAFILEKEKCHTAQGEGGPCQCNHIREGGQKLDEKCGTYYLNGPEALNILGLIKPYLICLKNIEILVSKKSQ
jgi:hypothetical protein